VLPVCHLLLENFHVIYFLQQINGFPLKHVFYPKISFSCENVISGSRMILSMMKSVYFEPFQRFTIRNDAKTIATGVVTKILANPPEELMESRTRKKLMKAQMEKLGFNPYNEELEKRLKPEYKEKRDMPLATVEK